MWQNLLAPPLPCLLFQHTWGGPDDLVESELLGCCQLSTKRTRTIYVNEKEEGRILRGEDNDVAYSQDRYIFHVVFIHHVDSVAVESMHGTSPVYLAPNSKEAEKDDEKTMVLRMQQKA
jgi:hypothetical protein